MVFWSALNVLAYGSQPVTAQPDESPASVPNAAKHRLNNPPWQSCLALSTHHTMNMLKNANWKNMLVTAVVAIIVVKVIYPLCAPLHKSENFRRGETTVRGNKKNHFFYRIAAGQMESFCRQI